MTRSFGVFFDLHLNNRLSTQSRGWWFETLSRPLWRHSNVLSYECGSSQCRRLTFDSWLFQCLWFCRRPYFQTVAWRCHQCDEMVRFRNVGEHYIHCNRQVRQGDSRVIIFICRQFLIWLAVANSKLLWEESSYCGFPCGEVGMYVTWHSNCAWNEPHCTMSFSPRFYIINICVTTNNGNYNHPHGSHYDGTDFHHMEMLCMAGDYKDNPHKSPKSCFR